MTPRRWIPYTRLRN